MEVTLRKAHKLIEKLHGRLAQIQISANVMLGIWETQSAEQRMVEARKQFNGTVEHQFNLLDARQEIRNSIQAANAISIDKLIAERKRKLDVVGVYRHILSTAHRSTITSGEAAGRKIKTLQDSASTSAYGAADEVMVSILPQEDIDGYTQTINRLQLEIEAIEDQLTNENASTKITLSQGVVATLKAEGLA